MLQGISFNLIIIRIDQGKTVETMHGTGNLLNSPTHGKHYRGGRPHFRPRLGGLTTTTTTTTMADGDGIAMVSFTETASAPEFGFGAKDVVDKMERI